MIYLDTHAVIWLYSGDETLFSEKALEALEGGSLAVSPAVVLEIQFLKEIGRIASKPEEIVSHLAERCHLSICRKKFVDVCFKAIAIDFTRDPFDRLITAHAALDDSLIITKDRSILRHYPHAVW